MEPLEELREIKIISIESEYYPDLLKKIEKPPRVLYVEGNTDILGTHSISIIGSRACSEEGTKTAKKFAYDLALQNITIISGMAARNRYSSTHRCA